MTTRVSVDVRKTTDGMNQDVQDENGRKVFGCREESEERLLLATSTLED